jgi:hypothetical protein
MRPLHNVSELRECIRQPGTVSVAVTAGTRIIRAVSSPEGVVLWSVDGQPQSEEYVGKLLSLDWADVTTDANLAD